MQNVGTPPYLIPVPEDSDTYKIPVDLATMAKKVSEYLSQVGDRAEKTTIISQYSGQNWDTSKTAPNVLVAAGVKNASSYSVTGSEAFVVLADVTGISAGAFVTFRGTLPAALRGVLPLKAVNATTKTVTLTLPRAPGNSGSAALTGVEMIPYWRPLKFTTPGSRLNLQLTVAERSTVRVELRYPSCELRYNHATSSKQIDMVLGFGIERVGQGWERATDFCRIGGYVQPTRWITGSGSATWTATLDAGTVCNLVPWGYVTGDSYTVGRVAYLMWNVTTAPTHDGASPITTVYEDPDG